MIKQLLKNEFWGMLNSLSGGKNKNKKVILVGGIGLLCLFGYLSAMYSMMFCESFSEIGAIHIVPLMIYFVASLMIFMFGLLYSGNMLFESKDYDLLMSMPIKTQTLLAAKLGGMYLSNMLVAVVIMVPALIIWEQYTEAGIAYLLLTIPFVPILPMVLTNLIGVVISYLSRFVKQKGLFTSVLTMIVLIGFIIGSSTTSSLSPEELTNLSEAFTNQIYRLLPISMLYARVIEGSISAYLLFAGISIACAVVFIAVVSKFFKKVHSALQSTAATSSKKVAKLAQRSGFMALIRKEFKMISSISIYAINTLFGLVMAIGFIIYSLFAGAEIKQTLYMYQEFVPFIPIITAIVFSITPTTTCSLSLEGKQFWILKSLPIAPADVLLSKVTFNLLLNIPVCIAAGSVISYIFAFDVIWTIIAIGFPLISCLLFSLNGIWLNVKFPNFEWTNPAVPVKQGMPVLLSILMLVVVLGGSSFLLYSVEGGLQVVARCYYLLMMMGLIISCFLFRYLVKNANQLILKEKE